MKTSKCFFQSYTIRISIPYLLITFCICCLTLIKASAQGDCDYEEEEIQMMGGGTFCDQEVYYLPDAPGYVQTPVVTFRCAIHLFRPIDQNILEPWNSTCIEGIFEQQEDWVNAIYNSNSTPVLPVSPPADDIGDSRIQFKFESVTLHNVTDNWVDIDSGGKCQPAYLAWEAEGLINIFYFLNSNTSAGGCGVASDKAVYMVNNMCSNLGYGAAQVLAHELGHVLGLPHTFGSIDCTNCTCSDDAFDDTYAPDCSKSWIDCGSLEPYPFVDCTNCSDGIGVSNNVMGYNGCRNYFSPKQIARMNYRARHEVPYIELLRECQKDPNRTITISSNQTWEVAKVFPGDVIIENNAIVTVRCMVSMPAGARIVVKPGSRLIIDGGKLTNNCGGMWVGVEVWGNDALSQTPETNQGVIELLNQARIENATTGVWVQRNDEDCNLVQGTSGGIVYARDSFIENCFVGVQFAPYVSFTSQGVMKANKSYFRNMSFRQTRPLNNDELFQAHVRLNGVSKVRFNGCSFLDDVPVDPQYINYYDGWKDMGIGIDASASTFRVSRWCDGVENMNGTCTGTWVPSIFEKLECGVLAMDGLGSKSFLVNHSEFTGNLVGINASGQSVGPAVTENVFNMQPVPTNFNLLDEPTDVIGTLFVESTGFELEENDYNGDPNAGGGPPNQVLVGAAFVATGINTNACYRNEFDGLDYGSHAQENNGGFDIQTSEHKGLQYLCNDFGQNGEDNLVDFDLADATSIANSQGQPNPTSIAANEFSHLDNCIQNDLDSDIEVFIHVLATDPPSAEPFSYYYGGGTDEFDLSNDQKPICFTESMVGDEWIQNAANNCPLNISSGGSKPALAVVKSTTQQILDDVVDIYRDNVDAGNPQGLIAYIQNSANTSLQVRNEMFACSPYISDLAWRKAFTRIPAMDPWHLAQVLLENSPLKPSVQNMMVQYGYDPFYQELVQNGQGGGLTHMMILESDMVTLSQKIESATQDYLRLCTIWNEDNLDINDALSIIGTSPTGDKVYARIALLIEKGDYTTAQTMIDNCESNDNRCAVLQIEKDVHQSGAGCPIYTTQQLADLEAIAADETKPGYTQARALLHTELGNMYYTDLRFTDDYRSLLVGKKKEKPLSPLGIYPNPAKDVVYFTCKIPEGVEQAVLELTDPTGKMIYTEQINSGKGIWELPLKNYAAGVYLSTLYFDKYKITTEKLTIVK